MAQSLSWLPTIGRSDVGRLVAQEPSLRQLLGLPKCSYQVVGVAPGRVEVFGHHTDYCFGVVGGFAINLGTVCLLAPSSSHWQIVTINENGNPISSQPMLFAGEGNVEQFPKGDWRRYFFGVVQAFEEAAGVVVHPHEVMVVSNLPVGAGLSSSASFELAVACALQAQYGTSLSKLELALLCKRAENEFAGCGCGLLDQAVSAFGMPSQMVRIDTIESSVLTFPCALDAVILVVHCGVSHQLTRTNYGEVAGLCQSINERVCSTGSPLSRRGLEFVSQLESLKVLQQLTEQEFSCAIHVVQSGALALQMEAAIREGQVAVAGECLSEIHRSLSDCHGVSCAELDELQAYMVNELPGVFGASMMGGGGGGAILAIVDRETAAAVRQTVTGKFNPPYILEVQPSAGAWGQRL